VHGAYGVTPNVSSFGGSTYHKLLGLYVVEINKSLMADGKGLAAFNTNA
jgi:hypothetical protein